MEQRLQGRLGAGRVNHLSQLVQQAQFLVNVQSKSLAYNKQLEQLKSQVSALRKHHGALRARLREAHEEGESAAWSGRQSILTAATAAQHVHKKRRQGAGDGGDGEDEDVEMDDGDILSKRKALAAAAAAAASAEAEALGVPDRDSLLGMTDPDELLAAMQNDVVAFSREEAARRGLLDEYLAFRLAGISMFQTSLGSLGGRVKRLAVRFDTSFEGQYQERFYVIFAHPNDSTPARPVAADGSSLTIFKHSVPTFIPLADLEREHLNTNTRKFCLLLSDYLAAYINRRGQVRLLREMGARGDSEFQLDAVNASMPFHLVHLRGSCVHQYGDGQRVRTTAFEIHLVYDNWLTQYIKPSRALVRVRQADAAPGDEMQRSMDAEACLMGGEDLVAGMQQLCGLFEL